MKLPWWYKGIILLWVFVIAPMWLSMSFVTGELFLSVAFANPEWGSGWQLSLAFQLVVIFAFLSPLLFFPLALFQALRPNRNIDAQD